ncbi:hypothetical protein [Burkholderia gladioli]|nr:hypothetical protein [Burkholderia gladioli]
MSQTPCQSGICFRIKFGDGLLLAAAGATHDVRDAIGRGVLGRVHQVLQ